MTSSGHLYLLFEPSATDFDLAAQLLSGSARFETEGLRVRASPALCPLARHINPSFVLVQPWKTRPNITESLLMGRKELNHIKQNKQTYFFKLLFR